MGVRPRPNPQFARTDLCGRNPSECNWTFPPARYGCGDGDQNNHDANPRRGRRRGWLAAPRSGREVKAAWKSNACEAQKCGIGFSPAPRPDTIMRLRGDDSGRPARPGWRAFGASAGTALSTSRLSRALGSAKPQAPAAPEPTSGVCAVACPSSPSPQGEWHLKLNRMVLDL